MQPEFFPELSMLIQSGVVQQRCDADCWRFGGHSAPVLHVEMLLGKQSPCGLVGIRKLKKEEALRDVDQMAVIEEGEKNESQD